MSRVPFLAILGLSSVLLLGCPARWKVVFINGTNEPLSVRLSGAPNSKLHNFSLSADSSRSASLRDVQRIGVFGPSGGLLFQRDDFGAKELAPPAQGKYPHIYVLLTTTNAYISPPDYRKTWREHINEIAKPGG